MQETEFKIPEEPTGKEGLNTYIALIRPDALHSTQILADIGPGHSQESWLDAPEAQVFAGIFQAHTRQGARKQAAESMSVCPKHIQVIQITGEGACIP